MTQSTHFTFTAIITIKLPGSDNASNLEVVLTAVDPIVTESGAIKLLQDCTLAELQQFADQYETEVWEKYRDSTLVDLVVDGNADIKFRPKDEQPSSKPDSELWLDHALVFDIPANQDRDIDDLVPEASTVKDIIVEEREVQEPEDPTRDPELPLIEVDLASDEALPVTEETTKEEVAGPPLETDTPEKEPETFDIEPEVTVSVAEPVHEEREAIKSDALPEYEPVIAKPYIRILGKRRPPGHSTWTAADILINESAFRDAQNHALTSLNKEVAGVLIGLPPEKQPDGRYVVHVSDIIIAKHTRMQGASVTYTPESWRYVNDKLAEMYPDDSAVIVGWYHTHPGFGIFLSSMDRFIHQNFFTQIWHIALVLDPIAKRSGFFCWDRNTTRVDAYEFPWPVWAANSW